MALLTDFNMNTGGSVGIIDQIDFFKSFSHNLSSIQGGMGSPRGPRQAAAASVAQDSSRSPRKELMQIFPTRMCNVTAWRHSRLLAHWLMALGA